MRKVTDQGLRCQGAQDPMVGQPEAPATMLPQQGTSDESQVSQRAAWGSGLGANTHGAFAARPSGEVWHGKAVGPDSIGGGASEALAAIAAEEFSDSETGEPDLAEPPALPEHLTQTYAHINSQPEDPTLLAQLSPTNMRARLKYLGPQHEVLARLFAAGMSVAEVSRAMGRYSQVRLSTIRLSPRFIVRVQQIQREMFGEGVQGRFARIGVRAVDIAEDLLHPTSNAGMELKFKVAKDMMDRAYGKAKETVEVKSNTVTDLFAALDKFKRGEMPSSEALGLLFGKDSEAHPVDSWVDAAVPAATGIGAPSGPALDPEPPLPEGAHGQET